MNNKKGSPLILNYLNIRKFVGILAMSIPFIVYLVELLAFNKGLQPSISLYYHTEMKWFFILALSAIGFFLFFYRGYDDIEDKWAKIAGILAILTAFFPALPKDSNIKIFDVIKEIVQAVPIDQKILFSVIADTVHKVSASGMFLIIAWFSYFRFTKSNGELTNEKKIRNNIYRFCGLAMAATILFMFLSMVLKVDLIKNTIFWGEAAALFFFGLSWMVKGEALFKDKKPEKKEIFNKMQSRQVDGYKSGLGFFLLIVSIFFAVLLLTAQIFPFTLLNDQTEDGEVDTAAEEMTNEDEPDAVVEEANIEEASDNGTKKNSESDDKKLDANKEEAKGLLNGLLFGLVVSIIFLILNYQIKPRLWPLIERSFSIDISDDKEGEKANLWTLFDDWVNKTEVSPRFSVVPRLTTDEFSPSSLTPDSSYLKTLFDILSWIFPRLGYSIQFKKIGSEDLDVGLSVSIRINASKEMVAEKIFWAKTYKVSNEKRGEAEKKIDTYQLLMIPAYFWISQKNDELDGFITDEYAWEAKANYFLGTELWHSDLDKGIALFSQSLSLDKKNWPAFAALGRCWIEKSQDNELKDKEIIVEYLLHAIGFLAIAIAELKNKKGEFDPVYYAASYNQIVALKYLCKHEYKKENNSYKKLLDRCVELKKEALGALLFEYEKISPIKGNADERVPKRKRDQGRYLNKRLIEMREMLKQEGTSNDCKSINWLIAYLPTLEFVLKNLEMLQSDYKVKDVFDWLEKAIKNDFNNLPCQVPPINMNQPFDPHSGIGYHFAQYHYRSQYNAACFYSQAASIASENNASRKIIDDLANLALDHLEMALCRGGGIVKFAAKDSSLDFISCKPRFILITKSKVTTKKASSLIDIEGIGPKYARILKDHGLSNTDDLLEHGATKSLRDKLAKKTKISIELLYKWIKMADLMRIDGIGKQYAELLVACGVDSIKELRTRNAKNLIKNWGTSSPALSKLEKLVDRFPAESEVNNWIDLSKDMEIVIQSN